jgi:hypothetical protein
VRDAISSLIGWVTDGLAGLFTRNVLTDEERDQIAANAADLTGRIIDGFIALPGRLFEVGVDAIQSLWDGMVARFDAFLEWVRGIPGRIIDAVGPFSLGDLIGGWGGERGSLPAENYTNPASEFSGLSGHRARGGPVWPGGSFLVGENEAEVFSPSTGGTITPISAIDRALDDLRSFGGGGGGNSSAAARQAAPVSVTIGDIVVNGAADAMATARIVRDTIVREIEEAMRASNADLPARS